MKKKPAEKRSSKLRTDRERLRNQSDGEIVKGIAADPDVHSTSAAFWDSAKVVMPIAKP